MPVMDGFSASLFIKSTPPYSELQTRIIACTAFGDTQTRIKW